MKDRASGKYLFVRGGGPYFERKERSYGAPKGGIEEGETLEECARREFFEETGIEASGDLTLVYDNNNDSSKRKKRLVFFLMENVDYPGDIKSNICTINYRGKDIQIPEVCDPKLLTLDEAEKIVYESQLGLIKTLKELEIKNICKPLL